MACGEQGHDSYRIRYSKHPLDPVEINGLTPPLVWISEDGSCSIPQPQGTDLGRFGENAEGVILSTGVGYVRIKRICEVISRPVVFPPTVFAWAEWFVGPIRR